jgi:hypothetical protein
MESRAANVQRKYCSCRLCGAGAFDNRNMLARESQQGSLLRVCENLPHLKLSEAAGIANMSNKFAQYPDCDGARHRDGHGAGTMMDCTFVSISIVQTDKIGMPLVAKCECELGPEHALGPSDVVPPDMIPGEVPAMAGH